MASILCVDDELHVVTLKAILEIWARPDNSNEYKRRDQQDPDQQ
jgi:hypothetical protein